MFPSGRFPRFALAAALLFVLLLFLDLEFVRSASTSLLATNSLDTAMVLLAAVCCFYAARRSSGYPRQLWLLLAVAFALETLGQAISTYYQSFVPGSAQSPWPSDVLFFVWAAPVFMIFLPRSEEDSSAIDSLRLLDFLQVAILAVTFYLYFFYSPSRWQSNQPVLVRQILLVYLSRDALLSVAFFFRSRASLPPWLRSFCLVLAAVFFTLVLADTEYLFALVNTRISAGWGDLIWILPSLVIILLAINWKQPSALALPSSDSRVGTLLNAQILPVAIPLLVIFMGRAIAREQVVLAWLVVAASVVCSSVRLILTNRRQRRISENLLNTERALRSSEEILSTAFRNSPDAFSINPFPNGPYLEVNEGYTRLTGCTREEVLGKTPAQMNLWVDFDRRDMVVAGLRESGHVRDFEFRFRTKSGQIRVGQMSASVIELHGQQCSLVIVRDVTERKAAEDILRSSEERFRSLVRDLHFAVVLHSPDARIEFANRAAHAMFGLPDGFAIGKTLPELGITTVDKNGYDIPYSQRPVLSVLRTRQPLHELLVGFRHSGSSNILWTFGNIVPQLGPNGELIRLISSFADITEMKNAERAIHDLSNRLLQLQDAERRRIGRELHDGLAQTVLAINLSLAQVRQSLSSQEEPAARSLEKARNLTQQMSREIRTLSYLLHPPLLDDLGLLSTLKEYVHGFSERSGIETQLLTLAPFARLPQPVEIALFRIVQESLANIQRHSGSATAQIRLSQQDSRIILEVIDHGHGILGTPPSSLEGAFPQGTALTGLGEGEAITGLAGRVKSDVHHGSASVHPEPRRAVPYNSDPLGALAPDGIRKDAAKTMFSSLPPDSPESFNTSAGRRITTLGVGIPGMRERMAQLGGQLDIISGPTGTTVRATISLPIPAQTESLDALSAHPDRG